MSRLLRSSFTSSSPSLTSSSTLRPPHYLLFNSPHIMRLLPLTLFSLAAIHQSLAGTLKTGQSCSTGSNRLQEGTYQFWSECDSVNFCSENGTCQLKGCRKDDFPFGYQQGSTIIPDKCKQGEFCPDEGSACQPLIAVGQPCQFNRDGTVYPQ